MTLEEALRFIDPETDLSELDKIEYYHGFNGKNAAAAALREASQMVVDFVRRMQWHDTKTDPPKRKIQTMMAKCSCGTKTYGRPLCLRGTLRQTGLITIHTGCRCLNRRRW